jgi:hypothetical protein
MQRDVRQKHQTHLLVPDNPLNTDYLGELIKRLKHDGYTFIGLNEALKDKVYQSKDHYTGRFRFS